MNQEVENIKKDKEKTVKIQKAFDDSSSEKRNSTGEIIDVFDEVISRQLNRLMNTNSTMVELPLNTFTLSSLVLLATRETEIEAFPYQPPPRYTQESLFEELLGISIDPGDNLSGCVELLKNKAYIDIADDGRLLSGKSALHMAQLLDRIFPKMPGLNLVAYLGQMIDEVSAQRKGIDEAAIQFNQLLDLQGVPLDTRPETSVKTGKKYHPHLRLGNDSKPSHNISQKPRVTASKPADIFSALEVKNFTPSPVFRENNKALEPELPFQDESPVAPASEKESVIENEINNIDKPVLNNEANTKVVFEETDSSANLKDDPETVTIPDSKEEDLFEPPDDTDIEAKIARFEEKLGMICPLCGISELKANETAKGKSYYQCINRECGFISWGKPFYLECPKCGNHFLIEAKDSSGILMLKCPRATCTHWQNFPGNESSESFRESFSIPDSSVPDKTARKKVRRVVRRKRR